MIVIKPRIFKKFPGVKIYLAIGAFNFSLTDRARVIQERKKLLLALKARSWNIATLSQVNSLKLIYATHKSKIDFLLGDLPEADGLYTDCANIYLGIRSADCLPILFYHKQARVIGAVHAGWRGTKKRIIIKAIKRVAREFGVPISGFYFFLGPAAQACCYNVDKYRKNQSFLDFFAQDLISKNGHLFLDFIGANIRELRAAGVPKQHIENCGICTIHNNFYPSHRREGIKRKKVLLSLIRLLFASVASEAATRRVGTSERATQTQGPKTFYDS